MTNVPPSPLPRLLTIQNGNGLMNENQKRVVTTFINQSMLRKIGKFDTPRQSFQTDKSNQRSRQPSSILQSTTDEMMSDNLSWLVSGEFRTLSIVFVKLHKPAFDPRFSQLAVSGFLTSLKKYEGFFQQYSVDDKGQTLMAVFGLPPLSHKSEPKYAVPAMQDFLIFASKNGITPISIGIATGELLFAVIGNTSRCEVSLLGDTVNIAARLMGMEFGHDIIICDENTHLGSSDMYAHTDLGMFKLKGKDSSQKIWKILPEIRTSLSNKEELFGYKEEREKLLDLFSKWETEDRKTNIFIEGHSGLGKSKLGTMLANHATDEGIPVWQYVLQFASYDPVKSENPNQNLSLNSLATGTAPTSPSLLSFQTYAASTVSVSRRRSQRGLKQDPSQWRPSKTARDSARNTGSDVEQFMKYYNEDPDMTPLLGLVVSELRVKDTEKTSKLDRQAKGNLARGLIIRIFSTFVSRQKVLFIFDDIQWLDELSLEIIFLLIKFSSKECILLLSRPVMDSGSDTLKAIFNHIHVERIQLGGLNLSAIEQMIIKKLSDSQYRVTSIEPRLLQGGLKGIFEKGLGVPLYTDMMSENLREKMNIEFQIDSSGCLMIADQNSAPSDHLFDHVGSAVMSHFDKLDPDFQEILRIASCLGQYFNLSDLVAISNLGFSLDDAKHILETKDRYNFVQVDEQERDEASGEVEATICCSFQHIAIMNAIYDSLSFLTRSSINEQAAKMFESLLCESNADAILPSVCFYYGRSKNTMKAVQYLEQLGTKYLQNFTFAEAAKTFDKLLNIVGSDQFLKIESLRRGNWLSCYAYAVTMRFNGAETFSYALKAIEAVDGPWPTDDKSIKKRFLKSLARFFLLWVRTSGGTKPLHRQKVAVATQQQATEITPTITREQVLERSMLTIYFSYGYHPKISGPIVALALIELLCMVIVRGYRDFAHWKMILVRSAYAFYFPFTSLARFLFKASLRIEHIGQQSQFHHYPFITLRMFLCPDLSVSHGYAERYAKFCFDRGDLAYRNAAVVNLIIIKYISGRDWELLDNMITPLVSDKNIFDVHTIALWFYYGRTHASFGNMELVAKSLDKVNALMTHSGWTNPFSLIAKYVLQFTLQLLQGQLADSVNSLHNGMKQGRLLSRVGPGSIECGAVSSIFLWLLIHEVNASAIQDRSGIVEIKSQLLLALVEGEAFLQNLGVQKKMIICWWSLHLYSAAISAVKGKTREAVALLRSKLKSPRRRELDEMLLYKAMYIAIIGKYSNNEYYLNLARKNFSEMGGAIFVKWLDA
ncbi:hypothetical protein HDU76_005256 [Blyttiomyces sp. JEL0837]|nr:hypothetical protein HDU76_005256 [Blyttiomyces sp. JEL0837]